MDETITQIEAWYDRYSQNWAVQRKNAKGYQIGSSDYSGHKDDCAAHFVCACKDHPDAERIFPKSLRAAINARFEKQG